MKTIRNIFLILFALFAFSAVQAQDKKVEFGFAGGYSYTMPRVNPLEATINTNNLSGVHVGPTLKFNIEEQFGLQTGVFFNYFSTVSIDRAQQAMKKATGIWSQNKTNLMSFDIPFRFMYSAPLAEDFYFFIFAGPNLNYSINKITTEEIYVDKKLRTSITGVNIYQKPSSFKPFDLQLGAGLGVQWLRVSLRGSFDWGILNRTIIENTTLRSNDIKVSLGYSF